MRADSAAAALDVRMGFLGPPVVMIGDVPARPTPGELRLLAVLAAAGPDGLAADELAYDLKPDRDLGDTSWLRMSVQRARRRLGLGIPNERGVYRLAVAVDCVDTWQLTSRGPTAMGALERLRLWRGAPFTGIDSTAFIDAERQLLHRHRISVAIELAARVDGPGPHAAEALGLLRRAVDDEPYGEALVAAVARAMFVAGDQVAALQAIRNCRDALVDEFGLEPGDTLERTELAILNHDLDALDVARGITERAEPVVSVAPRHPSLHDDVRFVGRGDVLDTLRNRLHRATRGDHGEVIVLLGAAGAGKTRVAARFLSEIDGQNDGPVVRTAVADGGRFHAYQLILDAFPEVGKLIPMLDDPDDQSLARLSFWNAAADTIAEVSARPGGCVVCLDDLHEADASSLQFLRRLAAAGVPSGLLVIGTARPPMSDTPWEESFRQIEHQYPGVAVEVGELGPDDVDALVQLDHPEAPSQRRYRFARRVHELSAGNALVASLLSGNASAELAASDLPADLTEVLAPHAHVARFVVERLTDSARDILATVSLIGLEFDLRIALDLLDHDPGDVVAAIETACERGIVRPATRYGRYRFNHALTVAALRDAAHHRTETFARLARHPGAADLDQARYVLGAGPLLPDEVVAEQLGEVGDRLARRSAFAEAADAYSILLDRLSPDHPERFEVTIRAAACSSRAAFFDRARELRTSAYELAGSDQVLRCRAALAGLPDGFNAGGEPDRVEVFESLDVSRLDRDLAERLFTNWSSQARILDRSESARRAFAAADRYYGSNGLPPFVAAHRVQVDNIGARPTRSVDFLLDAAAGAEDPRTRARILCLAYKQAVIEQRPDRRADLADRVDEIERDGIAIDRWYLACIEASLGQCGVDDARWSPEQAFELAESLGIPDGFVVFASHLYMDAWLDDQLPTALDLVETQRELLDFNISWNAAAAFAAAAAGQPDRARRRADVARDWLVEHPVEEWSLTVAALLTEVGRSLGDASFAEASMPVLRPHSGRAVMLGMGAAALGPVDRYLALGTRLTGSDGADALFAAAIDQAARTGCRRWADRARRDLDGVTPPTTNRIR